MAYIGTKPADKPLTSADITDGIIVNADINSSAAIAVSKLSATGTANQVLRMNSGATALEFATVSGTTFGSALLHVRDEKSSGTVGGTFTSGAWQTRTLNTVLTNEISGASLSSNQIILPSGTYYIFAYGNATAVGTHKTKLRNITDSSDTLIGRSSYANSNFDAGDTGNLIGRFTIAAQKTFEFQHRCENTVATHGFGYINVGFTVVEVYADVHIWKVA